MSYLVRNLINDNPLINHGFSQIVRWRRKPRWLPVAKSKRFLVPPRTETPENERNELLRLHAIYKTQMKSLRGFLSREYQADLVTVDVANVQKEFEADFTECKRINDEWNAQMSQIREIRLKADREAKEKEVLRNIEYRQQFLENRRLAADELIRAEKVKVPTFITRQNLDATIERILSEPPVDYNYALNKNGDRITTTYLDPVEKRSDENKKVEVQSSS